MKSILLKLTISVFLTSASTFSAGSVSYYEAYIDKYAPLAVEHQEQYGIPASITLAQGLLESAAGRSTLAAEGNNHFGIKCHNDWKGETMLRSDDAPDECFRVYNTPEESFRDHSLFLRRTRYKRLFDLDVTDYQSWARGLRECGYATDPNYAARLITIIERYSLHTFDTAGDTKGEDISDYIHHMLVSTHPVRRARGLHYVVATPGDTYASIAKEFKMQPQRLMALNDASSDKEIKAWEEVYLEEKHSSAPEGVDQVTIGEGESLHSISQRYGITMAHLKSLNPKAKDRPGTILNLH